MENFNREMFISKELKQSIDRQLPTDHAQILNPVPPQGRCYDKEKLALAGYKNFDGPLPIPFTTKNIKPDPEDVKIEPVVKVDPRFTIRFKKFIPQGLRPVKQDQTDDPLPQKLSRPKAEYSNPGYLKQIGTYDELSELFGDDHEEK